MYTPLQFNNFRNTKKRWVQPLRLSHRSRLKEWKGVELVCEKYGISLATNSSLPLLNPRRKCCLIEKKGRSPGSCIILPYPSHADAQWTLYSRLHLQLRGQLRHLPNSLLNHYWYLFFVYTLYIVFYIISNLTYCVFSYNRRIIAEFVQPLSTLANSLKKYFLSGSFAIFSAATCPRANQIFIDS